MAEARKHLNVEHTDDDLFIDGLIQAATDTIDGAQGWLGRALGPQTWDWFLDGCDAPRGHFLQVPLAPLIAVDEIEYLNTSGVLTAYTAFDVTGLNTTGFGQIRPDYNTTWPDVRDAGNAFRVRFQAGFGVSKGDSADVLVEAVPFAIKAAILLMVGDLYKHRETTADGSIAAVPMSATVETLLSPYRTWPQ